MSIPGANPNPIPSQPIMKQRSEKGQLFHFKCHEARGTGCLSLNGFRIKMSGLQSLFTKMSHLTHVYLSGCHLHGEVPSVFHLLKNLCLLDLSDNKFEKISVSTLTANNNLAVLDLSINKFIHLPSGAFRRMKALRELNIAQNDLVELPEDLGHLPSLEILNASQNLLRTLPDSLCLGSLRDSLKILRVQNNVLVELPENIGYLSRLEELDIRDNNVQRIPNSAKSLTKLQVLHYVGNRWPVRPLCTSGDVKQRQLDSSYGTQALEMLYRIISGGRLNDTDQLIAGTDSLGSLQMGLSSLQKGHPCNLDIKSNSKNELAIDSMVSEQDRNATDNVVEISKTMKENGTTNQNEIIQNRKEGSCTNAGNRERSSLSSVNEELTTNVLKSSFPTSPDTVSSISLGSHGQLKIEDLVITESTKT